jgi:hypothetical protein
MCVRHERENGSHARNARTQKTASTNSPPEAYAEAWRGPWFIWTMVRESE